MAYQALYRKYRPQFFNDFIDQDHIKEVLVNSIVNNRISHAYLFSGPRGIGKTSMAKIFAKAINCANFNGRKEICGECENCLECENSVDIIEIDAASNNGVDQIRELKNKVSIVPSKLKYKVYIIDEVHMLTNSAFNALLKTLEEPPSYVVFILATTEFYEVPETIVSRCQCFNFSRISLKSLCERLQYISKKEKIDIDDDAIMEIARYSNGGLRDAIGMLDKLNSFTNSKITIDIFKEINGMISSQDIENFYSYVMDGNIGKSLEMIDKVNSQGYDFKNFIERTMILTRDFVLKHYLEGIEIKKSVDDNVRFVEILNDILIRLKSAVDPIIVVQIYLLKYLEGTKIISREINDDQNCAKVEKKFISEKKKNNNETNNVKISKKNDQMHINNDIKNIRINNALATANKEYKNELNLIWKRLNSYFMDDKYGKISQLLSDTIPMVVGTNYLILVTSSDALLDKIYYNLNVVENFISNLYRDMHVVVVDNNEFDIIKKKYIDDKNNNINYEVQKEYGKLIEESNNLINQAIEMFGSDLVDVE